jgi:hypothetical protein
MQPLRDCELLDIWERGHGRGPIERALLLLSAAEPGISDAGGADIGERDAAILRLRQVTFGRQLHGCVQCPDCGERLEFALDAACLLLDTPADRQFIVANDLRFRLPNSRDLAAVAHLQSPEAAARQLLRLCCLDAPAEPDWPPTPLADVEARMAALQQAADIELKFSCTGCGHVWADHFDISAYFWEELEQRAGRMLDDVHRLAWFYGWDEQRILAMSDVRRVAYLARCDA